MPTVHSLPVDEQLKLDDYLLVHDPGGTKIAKVSQVIELAEEDLETADSYLRFSYDGDIITAPFKIRNLELYQFEPKDFSDEQSIRATSADTIGVGLVARALLGVKDAVAVDGFVSIQTPTGKTHFSQISAISNATDVITLVDEFPNYEDFAVDGMTAVFYTGTLQALVDVFDKDDNPLGAGGEDGEMNVQSDWNQTDTNSDQFILNKPTALTDFTNDLTINYSDIVGRPVNLTDLNNNLIISYNNLVDTPDLTVYALTNSLATVATSGDYDDLTNLPTNYYQTIQDSDGNSSDQETALRFSDNFTVTDASGYTFIDHSNIITVGEQVGLTPGEVNIQGFASTNLPHLNIIGAGVSGQDVGQVVFQHYHHVENETNTLFKIIGGSENHQIDPDDSDGYDEDGYLKFVSVESIDGSADTQYQILSLHKDKAVFDQEIYFNDVNTGSIATGGHLGLDSDGKLVKQAAADAVQFDDLSALLSFINEDSNVSGLAAGDLNKLAAVNATAAEINLLDGRGALVDAGGNGIHGTPAANQVVAWDATNTRLEWQTVSSGGSNQFSNQQALEDFITNKADFRSDIGAGTSNLAIGTGATDAKAGDYAPTNAEVQTALGVAAADDAHFYRGDGTFAAVPGGFDSSVANTFGATQTFPNINVQGTIFHDGDSDTRIVFLNNVASLQGGGGILNVYSDVITSSEPFRPGRHTTTELATIADNFTTTSRGALAYDITVSELKMFDGSDFVSLVSDQFENQASLEAFITQAADFREHIGAGTSNLTIGTTSTTAKAGNVTTITNEQITKLGHISVTGAVNLDNVLTGVGNGLNETAGEVSVDQSYAYDWTADHEWRKTDPEILFISTETSANGNEAGQIRFLAQNAGGNSHDFARILSTVTDNTSGQEEGRLRFQVYDDGNLTTGIQIQGPVTDINTVLDLNNVGTGSADDQILVINSSNRVHKVNAVDKVSNQQNTSNNIKFWHGTQAQYDAIDDADIDVNTIYFTT